MCLVMMHSEDLEDHNIALKCLKDCEDWCLEEGVNDLAKNAAFQLKYAIIHKD